MIGQGKGFCVLCLQDLSLELKDLISKLLGGLWLSAVRFGSRQLEPGSRQWFAHPSSRQWRAVEGFCPKLWHHYSLCHRKTFCLHHSFPSFTFQPTFLSLVVLSFVPSFVHSSSLLPSATSLLLLSVRLLFCWRLFPGLLLKLWSGSLTLPPSALSCLTTAILSPSKLSSNHYCQKTST